MTVICFYFINRQRVGEGKENFILFLPFLLFATNEYIKFDSHGDSCLHIVVLLYADSMFFHYMQLVLWSRF